MKRLQAPLEEGYGARGKTCAPEFKFGFTLIELLVYMALMGFVIVVAGRVFSDSTSMRVRSQSMLNSAEESGRVSALLKEDISQMGAKKWVDPATKDFKWASNVQISNSDLSSFVLTKNNPATDEKSFDSLTFWKAHYNTEGVCDAVLKIEWFVKNEALFRKCTLLDSDCPSGNFNTAADCPDSVEMATNVTEFRFLPSKPGIQPPSSSSYSPPSPADTLLSGTSFFFIKLPGNNQVGKVLGYPFDDTYKFSINSSSSGTETNNYLLGVGGGCQSFNFKAGEEYAIEFDLLHNVNTLKVSDPCITGAADCANSDRINKMTMFQAGNDHLSIGLRSPTTTNGSQISISDTPIPDFLFYPPQQEDANGINRHFVLSVPSDITACIGITAAFYSEAGEGHLDFRNFKVYRKTDKVYHFDRDPENQDYMPANNLKYAVKAFELSFSVNKRGEVSHTVTIIPVPSNGIGGGS